MAQINRKRAQNHANTVICFHKHAVGKQCSFKSAARTTGIMRKKIKHVEENKESISIPLS